MQLKNIACVITNAKSHINKLSLQYFTQSLDEMQVLKYSLKAHSSILETHIHFIFTDFSNRKKGHRKTSYIIIHVTNTEPWIRKRSQKKDWGWERDGHLLVHDFWVTVVTLQFWEDVVGVFAVEVAEAGLHPHHLPGEPRPIRTLKLHVDGFGLVGDAAALVGAHAAVFGPVRLRAGAAGDGEVWGLVFSVDVQTFLSRLMEEESRMRSSLGTFFSKSTFYHIAAEGTEVLPWYVWWCRPHRAAGCKGETLWPARTAHWR